MTGDTLHQTIVETTERTCETLAFMFAMPPPEDGPEPGEQEHCALARVRVHFSGPFEGSLTLSMPRSMLPPLAANMLGLDEDATTAEQRRDAACELCNVVCGNLLPAVAGADPVFTVSPPEFCDDPPAPDSASSLSARVWLDEGWVEVQFTVTGGLRMLEGRAPCCDDRAGLESVA
ncbi:MAG: chemotaxis protein CheX [Armatimonadota bacterium]